MHLVAVADRTAAKRKERGLTEQQIKRSDLLLFVAFPQSKTEMQQITKNPAASST